MYCLLYHRNSKKSNYVNKDERLHNLQKIKICGIIILYALEIKCTVVHKRKEVEKMKADKKQKWSYAKSYIKLSRKLRNFQIGESFRAFVDSTEARVITNARETYKITNHQFEKVLIRIANNNKKSRFVEWVMYPLRNVDGGTYNVGAELVRK